MWLTLLRLVWVSDNGVPLHKYAMEACRHAWGSLDVIKWGFMTGKPQVYDGQSLTPSMRCISMQFEYNYTEEYGLAGRYLGV